MSLLRRSILKRSKLDKDKYGNTVQGEKDTGKEDGGEPSAQGDKSKEKPDSSWNKGSCDLRVRPHPDNLPTCENELKNS